MWAWPFGVGVAFQRCARFSRGRAYGKGQLVKERVMGVPSPGWGGGPSLRQASRRSALGLGTACAWCLRPLSPSDVTSSLTTISTGAGTTMMTSAAAQCSTWPPCSGWLCSARRSWTGSARSLEVGGAALPDRAREDGRQGPGSKEGSPFSAACLSLLSP